MHHAKRLKAVGIVTSLPSTNPPPMHGFDAMADSALIRLSKLIGTRKSPQDTALVPFSAATLWRKVKAGTFPQPLKLSARVTAWRVGDIRAWLQQQTGGKV